ncbi:MAG TPA: hypothetical protein VMD74_00815 [Candidatus Methylomirabilis sp.]|nr:hypothetical protein [Candidatus Methylomirabilis sp.]
MSVVFVFGMLLVLVVANAETHFTAPGGSFVLKSKRLSSDVAKECGETLAEFNRANGWDPNKDFTLDSGMMVAVPNKFAIATADASVSKSAPKIKVRKHASGLVADGKPGPVHWRKFGYRYYTGDPESAWLLLGFCEWPGVLDSLKIKFQRSDYVRSELHKGDMLIQMVFGDHIVEGTGVGVLVDPEDPNYVVYGNLYTIVIQGRTFKIFKPDACNNWCWWMIPPPELPPVVLDSTPVAKTPNCPPCTNCPPPDTTPKKLDTLPSVPPDTSPVTIKPPKDKRVPYAEAFLWFGHDFPLPVFWDGHNYLGGIGNFFLPAGELSGYGLSFKLNLYQGWGPRPIDVPSDSIYPDLYSGFNVGIGPIADLRSSTTDRTTVALRYYVEGDWFWNKFGEGDTMNYRNRQITQLAGSELTFYLSNYDWSKWFQCYFDWRYDLTSLGSRLFSARRISFSDGQQLNFDDDPPRNKTVVNWGLGWYFLSLSKSKLWTLGAKFKGDHMLEDQRWELGGGPSVRYKQIQMGLEVKRTFYSIYELQNGWSIRAVLDVDPTPRGSRVPKKLIVN